MPDVESQLRQYFDSTVERLDVDDVLSGARVSNQMERWDVRAKRPLRTAMAAAVLVTVAISAVALGAWMLGSAGSRIGDPGPTPTATQPLAPATWPILLMAGGAVGVFATTLTMRKRKGGSMDTLERQEPEAQIQHLQHSNRGLIIALVLSLIALAGLGTWVLFDKVIDTGVEADIHALLDEYISDGNASDFEANLDLMKDRFVFIDGDFNRIFKDEYVGNYERTEIIYGDFQVELLGDPVILEDTDRGVYYVAVPMQIGAGAEPYLKGFSTFVIHEGPDGELLLRSHQWSPPNNYR
jgi:hypothetical protein